MSTEHTTPGMFILLLSLGFKFVNIFMEDTEILSILNVPFLILHNIHGVSFLNIFATYLLSV